MDFKTASKILILALASGSLALPALAQWQWIDKDGRRVFSDRGPPAGIPVKSILKQPGVTNTVQPGPKSAMTATGSDSAAPAASAPGSKTNAPQLLSKDTELEAKKKKAEEEAAAQKKAEEEKQAKAREESCRQAQKGLVTMQSGVRVSTTNAHGEREFMDDATRAAETKRLQGIADSDCKK